MKLTADAAVTLHNVPGMHKLVSYTSPQNFIIRSLDLQKLPNNLVPCLAPKSVHTVRLSNLEIHVCSSDLC